MRVHLTVVLGCVAAQVRPAGLLITRRLTPVKGRGDHDERRHATIRRTVERSSAPRAILVTMRSDPLLGVTATYHKLVEYVSEAVEIRERLYKRLAADQLHKAALPVRWFGRLTGGTIWGVTLLRWAGQIFSTTSATPKVDREALSELATDDEREARAFQHIIAEYWIESLAKACCAEFNLDSQQLTALHKIHTLGETGTSFQRFSQPQRFIALAGVALGIFVALVPKEAFEALGWTTHSYDVVRAGIAVAIIGIVLYLTLLTGLVELGRRNRLHRRTVRLLPDVLTYCEIACGSGPAPTGRPGAGRWSS